MSASIAVVGSINQDIVVHAARVPDAGQTIVGKSVALQPGGKGANQAVALARLGMPTLMLGCVGSDSFGGDLLQSLTAGGVDTTIVTTINGSSGSALVQLDETGDNRITVIPGANAALSTALLQEHWDRLSQCSMILTQLETPISTVMALAQDCRSAGIPLMLDPAPAEPLSAELLQAVTWLTPNLSEAQTLLNTSDTPCNVEEAKAMAERLLALGPRNVLLKLGSMGAAVAGYQSPSLFQKAFAVSVQDTTAAGDATNAAFAAALSRACTIDVALRFACGAAALCVSKSGAQQSMPTLAEVEAFLRNA